VAIGVPVGRGDLAVVGSGDKAGLLYFAVHGFLEERVKAARLVRHGGEIGQFGLAGDAELMGTEARQTEPLRVGGDEFDSHKDDRG
jgi:hypothetical protein